MAETHTRTAPAPTLSPSLSPSISTRPCDHENNIEEAHGFNLMVLLLAIVCAFLCALGLNTMLHCVFQCANRVLTEPLQWIASRRLNSGLKKKEMVALPTSTYYSTNSHSSHHSPSSASASASASNCAICLTEFCDGEEIRFLPKCNHPFHVACIDKWLLSHSSCPTCRHLLKPNHSLHSSLHIVIPNN